tara:strand:- start:684 stop:914 length:231 start_codon:yes stop_codon:yes gene_type:complete
VDTIFGNKWENLMVKIGNRVSLFNNIVKEGTVIGLRPRKTTTWHTGGASSKGWDIIINWDDGSQSIEKSGDVMRID